MKSSLIIILLLLAFLTDGYGQSRKELEDQRKKTLEEIDYVDKLLKTTAKQKSAGMNDLKIIVNRINLREEVISGLRGEISLLNYRIELNTLAISMMESDLEKLRSEYAQSIRLAHKASKGYHPAILIMSAEDFNQGYKRLKYLQQGARFRRRQAEIISEIVQEVSDSKARLEGDMAKLSDLRGREESQKQLLEQEQKKKQSLVRELTGKEKKLQQDLQEKKKIATRIQSEINKIIEEEKKKAVKSDMTPEQKLAGADFAGNKGLLPWPVERGVVTSTFGKHTHPDFKNIVEDNDGIDITSVGNTPVRSIFRGEVVRVFSIPGANMAVIIRHGRYLTVYQGIVNVRVKAGNKVETKQTIGDLYIEPDSGNKGVLNFMIYDEGVKLNPEIWIAPKK